MEKETYAFELWLQDLEKDFLKKNREEILEKITQEMSERFGARIWFAEILGKRWSYKAGVGQEFPAPALFTLILSPSWGMVAEGWEKIPEWERNILVRFLKTHLVE
ncbi:MAG: hypothetical protein ACUVQZ_09935 [Candidatus Caldatribacteriaceae bacterium]